MKDLRLIENCQNFREDKRMRTRKKSLNNQKASRNLRCAKDFLIFFLIVLKICCIHNNWILLKVPQNQKS